MREGKASLKHKATSPENKGPILCEETDLITIQRALIRHIVAAVSVLLLVAVGFGHLLPEMESI